MSFPKEQKIILMKKKRHYLQEMEKKPSDFLGFFFRNFIQESFFCMLRSHFLFFQVCSELFGYLGININNKH